MTITKFRVTVSRDRFRKGYWQVTESGYHNQKLVSSQRVAGAATYKEALAKAKAHRKSLPPTPYIHR